jgi:hypothetical protein
MADLSDVTAYLATAASNAAYPNGTSQPSVAAMDCRIFEGWPIPDQLDRDMLGQMLSGTTVVPRSGGRVANVSVYPMPGTGIVVYQQQDQTYVITPPAISSTFTLVGNVITVTGQPAPGEYLTLVVDDAYVYSQTGASTSALLNNLLTLTTPIYDHNGILVGTAGPLSTDYPGTVATATTLTVPFGHSLVVRQGGAAVLGKVTHRQRQSVMVTVWAPTHGTRDSLAKAIDNAIKQVIKVAMPDTSQALIIYSRTNVSDERQATAIYRRDLIYDVEYATVFQFPGYVVTSVTTSIANPTNTAIATALT